MAETIKLSIPVSEKIGEVSGLAVVPRGATKLLLLAHGAGAGMTHPFMEELANELYDLKVATLRYQFPFMEKGSRRPDPPAIAEKTVSSVLEFAHKKYPKLELYAGGKSFGGRMTSQRVAKECPD